jgi:hypothetical protein
MQLPEQDQKIARKGMDKGRNIFNKSKQRMEDLSQANKTT